MNDAGDEPPSIPMIEWKDEYLTGLKSIDYEHRVLINSINILCGQAAVGSTDDAVMALDRIFTLVEVHFVLEEKIMRDMDYPQYTVHKRDHDLMLDEIISIIDAAPTKDPAYIMPQLSKRAAGWFDNHLKTHDRALHSQL